MKDLLRGPRPFWIDPSLTEWEETGFGVPSNHMQNATIIYFYLAAEVRKRWFWFLAVLLVFLMAVSRMMLAAHFLHDVVLGFLVALLMLALFFWLRRKRGAQFSERILGQRLLVMLLIPLGLGVVYLLIQWLLPEPAPGLGWASFIPGAVREGQEVIVTAVATLTGFGIGIMMEGSRVRFRTDGPVWERGMRYLVGIVVAVAIWAGIRQLSPEEPLWLALLLRFVRYALLTLWISWYGPALFVRLGLAESAPPPELNISLRRPSSEQ